jgi:hypothetical protein
MPTIKFVDFVNETQADIDFADLVTIIKGSSVKSMALADNFFELGLTDAFNLRMNGPPDILLMSTLNKGEHPPTQVSVADHQLARRHRRAARLALRLPARSPGAPRREAHRTAPGGMAAGGVALQALGESRHAMVRGSGESCPDHPERPRPLRWCRLT